MDEVDDALPQDKPGDDEVQGQGHMTVDASANLLVVNYGRLAIVEQPCWKCQES